MNRHREIAANRFLSGSLRAPGSYGCGRLLPATVKSGAAASVQSGRAHLIHRAAIATDGASAVLAAQWVCGGGSINARPVEVTPDVCGNCLYLRRFPQPDGFVVYRCFDRAGDLLYIGSTGNLRQRLCAHRATAPWWDDEIEVEIEPDDTELSVRLTEALAITAELPRHNQHNIPLRLIRGGDSA